MYLTVISGLKGPGDRGEKLEEQQGGRWGGGGGGGTMREREEEGQS